MPIGPGVEENICASIKKKKGCDPTVDNTLYETKTMKKTTIKL